MQKVETINWDKSVKTKLTKPVEKKCHHIGKLVQGEMYDYKNDEVYNIVACKQCGAILTPWEINERKNLLNK